MASLLKALQGIDTKNAFYQPKGVVIDVLAVHVICPLALRFYLDVFGHLVADAHVAHRHCEKQKKAARQGARSRKCGILDGRRWQAALRSLDEREPRKRTARALSELVH